MNQYSELNALFAPMAGEIWGPTMALRWYRPPGGTDVDLELQQAWQSRSGKVEWRPLEVVMAD